MPTWPGDAATLVCYQTTPTHKPYPGQRGLSPFGSAGKYGRGYRWRLHSKDDVAHVADGADSAIGEDVWFVAAEYQEIARGNLVPAVRSFDD